MVWNVLRKDFMMGDYDVALKRMHRYDSLKKQSRQWHSLLSKLVLNEDDIGTSYATHSDTGIVYDIRIIEKNINKLKVELDELEEYS
jgi:hypothetical protein